MGILKGMAFLFALGAYILTASGSAAAETLTVTGGKLRVQARVLPAHVIVLDEAGDIKQILSNTNEDVVAPKAYLVNVDTAHEQKLTQTVLDEYRRLVPPGSSRIGVLYDRESIFTVLQASIALPVVLSDHRPILFAFR